MATYKVLQDIEAEDKFFGPLTLKQCIFGAIAVVSAYLSFIFRSKGIWVMAIPMLPIIVVTGFLAFPWGRDQPTEVWLLAKIKFMFKPRKRIWDQTGIQELVKITAPPEVVQYTGDDLTQTEVRSRLKALADTIDSRGWAIKGATLQDASAPTDSDRLIAGSMLPTVNNPDADPGVDIYDTARAQQIDTQITSSGMQHKDRIIENVQTARDISTGQTPPPDNMWFMSQPASTAPGQAMFTTQAQASTIVDDPGLSPLFSSAAAQTDPDDEALLSTIRSKRNVASHNFQNHKTLNPYDPNPVNNPTPPVTPMGSPATIELARNNDRSIDSLAREAGDDEVVISLH